MPGGVGDGEDAKTQKQVLHWDGYNSYKVHGSTEERVFNVLWAAWRNG